MVFDELDKDTMEMKTTLGKSVLAVSAPNEEPLNTLAQDDISFAVLPYLTREISATSFASAGTVDTNTVTLAAGHGVVVGDSVIVKGLYIGRALVVAGNVITLNQRFNLTFPIGTVCYRGSPNMVVDGSVSPMLFGLEAAPGIKFDVYKMRLAFRGTAEPDDAKFAMLAAALANGMIVRARISATRYNNYFNARNNSEFHLRGNLTYNAKAPAGSFGMVFEFPLKDDNGVALRIDGTTGSRLEIIIQDKLDGSTLTYMEGTVSAHVVED